MYLTITEVNCNLEIEGIHVTWILRQKDNMDFIQILNLEDTGFLILDQSIERTGWATLGFSFHKTEPNRKPGS